MSEQYLELNGANICYEVQGSGPYIVFVAGGNGGHRLFIRIRDLLVKYFTVVLYDRRGYFRSKLTGPQDYSRVIDTNVEDLHQLMKHITDEKFIIFGISGSGSILLKYCITYPDTFLKLFIHEPVIFTEHFHRTKEFQYLHYYLYRLSHYESMKASTKLFAKAYFNELDNHILVREQRNNKSDNWSYWLEHECCEMPFFDIDLELVKSHGDKLIFLHGEESREFFIYEPGAFVAKSLGKETIPVPGGHLGFYTHSKEFKRSFIKLCQADALIEHHQSTI